MKDNFTELWNIVTIVGKAKVELRDSLLQLKHQKNKDKNIDQFIKIAKISLEEISNKSQELESILNKIKNV